MTNSLLATILGLDWKDFLLHLLNFVILVAIVGLLVYKPVIRFIHARRDEIESQIKTHEEKMQEAEETKAKYAALIGSAEQEIAARKKEADAEAAKQAEAALEEAKTRAEQLITQAEEEAKREKVKAVAAIKGEVAEVAVLIASGILDKEITPEENEKIIDDCLKEWDENNA